MTTYSPARRVALDLTTDLGNIDVYGDQGNREIVVALVEAAENKVAEIQAHLEATRRGLGIRPSLVINHRREG